MALPEVIGNKFFYFGYGSNLLQKRISIQNKSAVRKGVGKLKDYKFEFYSESDRWKGSPATIVPAPNRYVLGAVWEMDLENMKSLDEQESVNIGIYIPLSLPIEMKDGKMITCRVYRLKNLSDDILTKDTKDFKHNEIPINRQPSLTYLKTIVKGATESDIPKEYIDFLKSFKNNGNIVPKFEEELELQSFNL